MSRGERAVMRRAALQARAALSPEQVSEFSRAVARRFFALPEVAGAEGIMFYLAFRNEVDTLPMVREALESGKLVAAPRTLVAERRLVPVRLCRPGALAPGGYGILEPAGPEAVPVDPARLDVVAVPGVLFDVSGRRLGYGAGYYDRFLAGLVPRPLCVGLAYDFQVVAALPERPGDVPVDIIVTETRVVRAGGACGGGDGDAGGSGLQDRRRPPAPG
ncbi:MAG: 5-formyltetrahydrofolate cyclo-ligase [Acetobacteraceae bacterium]|nr:5-formyltetrahydrofolate cyclo-ligase [Acetobacteraceae bacterium]